MSVNIKIAEKKRIYENKLLKLIFDITVGYFNKEIILKDLNIKEKYIGNRKNALKTQLCIRTDTYL